MGTEIASTIGNILINILSSAVYDKGKTFFVSSRMEQIKEKINDWVKKFFSTHVEAIFDSSGFSNYITYEKPFDKICNYVFCANEVGRIAEQDFVSGLVSECKKNIIEAGDKCSGFEESTIRDLFGGVLCLYKNALFGEASQGEKIILYQDQQSDIKMDANFKHIDQKIDGLRNELIQQNQITDPVTIENAYKLLSSAIWDGKLVKVYNFLPVLAGKNDDLENAVKIKLKVLSDYSFLIDDPLNVCCSIKNPTIKDDVFRLLLLENFAMSDRLAPYIDSISNPILKKIMVAIVDNRIEDVITISKSSQNNTTCLSYEIADGLESEEWLVKRLCILHMVSLPICNLSKTIAALVEQPDFISQLYIWENYLNEVIVFDSNGKQKDSEEFQDYISKMKREIDTYKHARLDFQRRFYLTLIRGMLLIENISITEVVDSLPENIVKLPEIEAFRMIQDIKERKVDQDSIIRFVLRTEQYWVLVNYCDSLEDYEKALDAINQVKWLIGQKFEIFECAVITTSYAKGNQDALELLKQYEKNYSEYIEFWIRAYWLSKTDTDRQWAVNSVVSKMRSEECKFGSLDSKKELSKILIKEGKYIEAIDILSSIEQMGFGNADITRWKIEAYMNSGHQIDALTEINAHYEELKEDVRILDLLLSISLINKRPIHDEVLSHVKGYNDARILMLAAEIEYIRKNTDEAKKLAMQSMMISSSDKEELFDIAIKYFSGENSPGHRAPYRIKEDTFFIVEDLQDQTRLTFCIYKEKIVPKSEYQWKGAWHIYIDDAVNMNYVRLTAGDIIDFKDHSYKIVSIAPIEVFYFRVCMDSMILRKKAWAITGKSPEDMMQGIVDTYRQHPGWKKQDWNQMYSDFSQTALPIYLMKSFVHLEYGQIMRGLMDDPSMIVREYIFPVRDYKNREYVITYTALVEMHKLGIIPMELCNNLIIVPNSAVIEADREAAAIYKNYDRELVASLTIQDDKVQIFKSEEDVKRENIRQAVSFKNYVSRFTSMENLQDMEIEVLQNKDITEIIGICDYDAIILAHTKGAVLITGEMLSASLTKLDETKADVAGIADFFCLINIPIMKLFGIVELMFQYRFYAAITPTVVLYIKNSYDIADEGRKVEIVEAWEDILRIPEELMDEKYKDKFKVACLEVLHLLKADDVDFEHPIIQTFSWAVFYYNNYRIDYYIENGSMYYSIVQINREKSPADIGLSEENE